MRVWEQVLAELRGLRNEITKLAAAVEKLAGAPAGAAPGDAGAPATTPAPQPATPPAPGP